MEDEVRRMVIDELETLELETEEKESFTLGYALGKNCIEQLVEYILSPDFLKLIAQKEGDNGDTIS